MWRSNYLIMGITDGGYSRNIGIVCFIIELHQFTSGTPYIPKKKENKTYKFDHCTIAVIV